MDASLIALAAGALAALVTVVGAFFGSAWQARRDHRRWVRERRYEAFVEILAVIRATEDARLRHEKLATDADEDTLLRSNAAFESVLARLPDAVARITLVGPDAVADAADHAWNMALGGDPDSRAKATHDLVRGARAALAIG